MFCFLLSHSMSRHIALRPGSPRIRGHVRIGSLGTTLEVLKGLKNGDRMYARRSSEAHFSRVVYSAWTQVRCDSSSARCCHVLLYESSYP